MGQERGSRMSTEGADHGVPKGCKESGSSRWGGGSEIPREYWARVSVVLVS